MTSMTTRRSQARSPPRGSAYRSCRGAGRLQAHRRATTSTASVPDDYRLRHPIAIQEADRSIVVFVGRGRGGLSASQRADVMGLAQTWLREGTGAHQHRRAGRYAERAGGRGIRCAKSRRRFAAAGVPPRGVVVRQYHPRRPAPYGGDPAELSEDLGRRRPLRPVARGPRPVDQQQGLFRKQALLQFRLRQPAQPGGDGRQSVRPRAAARGNAGLSRRGATPPSRSIARAPRPRPPIPRPTRPNSAIQANDQLRAPESRTAAGRHIAAADDHIAPAPRVSVQAFCETVETAAAVQSAGEDRRLGKAHLKIQMGGMAAAIEAYRTAPTPNVIILETEGRNDILAGLDQLATVCDAGTRVIVIGRINDVTLYRELVRRGVSDYVHRAGHRDRRGALGLQPVLGAGGQGRRPHHRHRRRQGRRRRVHRRA